MIVNGSCLRRSLHLAASSTALATGLAFLPNEAHAQCAPIGPTQVVCSGPNTTTQNINIHDAAVSTFSGFSVDTTLTGGNALDIQASGALSYNDVNAASLTGADIGLRMLTMGAFANPGSITIDTAGVITGQNAGVSTLNRGTGTTNIRVGDVLALRPGFGVGMSIVNQLDATGLTINAGNVAGAFSGIYALNGGAGNTDITVTGQVVGGSGFGLHALNNSIAGGDLSIRAGVVHGGNRGIIAENFGHGATHVVVDEVIAADGTGITGYNGANATDLTIDAGNVTASSTTGGDGGIQAQNGGTGATRVTSTGTVSSGVTGIFLSNSATATHQTVEANNVTGGLTGIAVFNNGTGVTRIHTTGDVIGSSLDGIFSYAGTNAAGTVVQVNNVTGGQNGIEVEHNSASLIGTQIYSSGNVIGTNGTGILVTNNGGGGFNDQVTVDVTNVAGGVDGIRLTNNGFGNSFTFLRAAGDIVGGSGRGILVDNGPGTSGMTIHVNNVTGATNAIEAVNMGNGATRVEATGLVTGTGESGIDVRTGINTTDLTVRAVNVTGGINGMRVSNNGTGETHILATGTVSTDGVGFGILAANSVAATGLTIEAVDVRGGQGGIFALHQGTGTTRVTSTGTVASTAASGNAIQVQNSIDGGDVFLEATNATGANGIYVLNAGSGSTYVSATGNVIGTDGNFGMFVNNEANATDLTVNVANVSHDRLQAMSIVNEGTGATSITATGSVTGGGAAGMFVRNGATATDLRINAVDVTGRSDGIFARNEGTGATAITATGRVAGSSNLGIGAINSAGTTDLSIRAVDVEGGLHGVFASNMGSGATRVIVTGTVAGGTTGISANNNGSATDLTIESVNVTGATGIFADNFGTGTTSVTATGSVTGTSAAGIFAQTAGTGSGLTIDAADVTGATSGIAAYNSAGGATAVTATGTVVGTGANGIEVVNSAAATALRVEAAAVSGGDIGILASNEGSGATSITTVGDVIGGGTAGMSVYNRGTDLTIEAVRVSGRDYGIVVNNSGTGNTVIVATGTVTGNGNAGIVAFNSSQSRDLRIEAVTVNGGIDAINSGVGTSSIIATGMVTGSIGLLSSAIHATGNGQPIDIVLSGAASGARNSSGLASDLAVVAGGGPVRLTNQGQVTGGVQFSGVFADHVANTGVWSVAGTSDFGAGVDTVANDLSGTLRVSGQVQFNNLENFTSHGLVTMQNGAAGDRFVTPANISLMPGSQLAIEINAAGLADSIHTTGSANITGAALDVSTQGVRVGRYTVVTADGGLIGTFASVAGIGPISAFAGITDSYDATNAYLDVLQVRDFADAGLTRNQKAAATGVQSLSGGNPFFAGNPLYDAILALPTDAAARNAFDQVSGEAHASAQTALIEDSRFVRDAATNRIRAAFGAIGASRAPVMAFADPIYNGPAMAYAALDPGRASSVAVAPTTDRFALWGQGFGGWGHTNSDGNAARLNRSTGGFLIGGDAPIFETWRLGMMAGYSRTTFNVRDRASSGASDNYHLGLYGGTQWGNLGFRTGAAYTWHDMTLNRSVAFAGFGDSLKADYRAGTAQVFGELGYGVRIGSFGLEPFANLAYVNFHTDGFAEQGGAAALRSTTNNTGVTFTTLGVHASTDVDLGATTATLRGTVGWRHAFGDATPLATFAFAGGSLFTVAGVPIAKDALVLDAGVDLAITRNATLGISYSGQFASSASDQSIRANFNVKF